MKSYKHKKLLKKLEALGVAERKQDSFYVNGWEIAYYRYKEAPIYVLITDLQFHWTPCPTHEVAYEAIINATTWALGRAER